MRILVVGLIRNGSGHIRLEVEHVHRVFSELGEADVFIVESDSDDDTTSTLAEMNRELPWFSFVSLGSLAQEFPVRTERLALCRNRYVDEIASRGLSGDDLVVAVDFDLRNELLTSQMIAHCLQDDDWDILTANQKGPYYDIWALRHPTLSPNDYRSAMDDYRRFGMSEHTAALRTLYARMVTIPTNVARIRVQSAFGGLALYRPWVFGASRYAGVDDDGNEVSEHVPFSLHLVEQGARIFIDPTLTPLARTEHSSILGIMQARARRLLSRRTRPKNGQVMTSNTAPDLAPPAVGVAVPTLGTRPEYLLESLASIRNAGSAHIVLVRPPSALIEQDALDLVDSVVDDPGSGLAAAINAAIRSLPADLPLVTWLGDDDRLTPGSLTKAAGEMIAAGASAVFGQCQYIDEGGKPLWLNKSGRWASPLMLIGPQLVPQPGSILRREDFVAVGGLDESLKWAFDLDLLLKLRKRPGGLRFVKSPLAEFRWHQGSLSVGGRIGSVTEASAIRRTHLPQPFRALSRLWEPSLRRLILAAGERMNHRLERRT